MTAAVMRQSWLRLLGFRIVMVGLLMAWKDHGIDNAGNLFTFMIWFAMIICVLAALLPTTKQTIVQSELQQSVVNSYRAAFVGVLAWYGHPGLAIVFLVGVLAAEIHNRKFDENGMPLPKKVGAA